MFKSGKDIIELRNLIKEKLVNNFDKEIQINLSLLNPKNLEMFIELFAFRPQTVKLTKEHLSQFISTIISAFIINKKMEELPTELKDLNSNEKLEEFFGFNDNNNNDDKDFFGFNDNNNNEENYTEGDDWKY